MYDSFDTPEEHYLHRLYAADSGRDFHPCFGAACEGGFYFRFPVRNEERQRFPDLDADVFFRVDQTGNAQRIDQNQWDQARDDA